MQAITVQQLVTVGQIVNYVLHDGRNKGKIRPAIIVRVWGDTCVNLQVFVDGDNDFPHSTSPVWITSSVYSGNKEPRTWHHWVSDYEQIDGNVEVVGESQE